MDKYPHDPDGRTAVGVNWGDSNGLNVEGGDGWLQGADVVTSSWIVQGPTVPPFLVTESPEINDDLTRTKVFVTGGVEGMAYFLTNRITATNGENQDQTVKIMVDSL